MSLLDYIPNFIFMVKTPLISRLMEVQFYKNQDSDIFLLEKKFVFIKKIEFFFFFHELI